MSTEQFVGFADTNTREMLGQMSNVGSSGPGGSGSVANTIQWFPAINRHARQVQVTGTAGSGFQAMNGIQPNWRIPGLFGANPRGRGLVRIRADIGMEYLSGASVSRVGWGAMVNWNANNSIQPGVGNLGDAGFIGFLWRQIGAAAANIFAIATDLSSGLTGLNIFSADTGIVGAAGGVGPTTHSFRIDFDSVNGQIIFYINEVAVATFTPTAGQFAIATTSAYRIGMGVHSANGNVTRGYDFMVGEGGLVTMVNGGVA